MTGWCRHTTRWLAPATPVLLVSRPQDAIEARLAGQVTPLVGQPWYDLTRRQRGELLAIADVQHGLPLLWTQGMGWRRANRIRPPIGTQLRLGQPALERCADSAPTPRPQDACGRQLQALRATMQRIAAALATRSIGLVDVAPVGIELFAISAELPPRPGPCL